MDNEITTTKLAPGSVGDAELSETVHKLIAEAGEASGRAFKARLWVLVASAWFSGFAVGTSVTLLVTM